MPVPEGTVHEDRQSQARPCDIWTASDLARMKSPTSNSGCPKNLSQADLRPRITGPNPPHKLASLLRREWIRHFRAGYSIEPNAAVVAGYGTDGASPVVGGLPDGQMERSTWDSYRGFPLGLRTVLSTLVQPHIRRTARFRHMEGDRCPQYCL
jgi:hypothetical protein